MGSLDTDTAIRRQGDGLFADLSSNWELWGPAGGYVAAIALRAAGAVAPPDHRPATLSVQFLGVGEFRQAEVSAVPLKQGRSTWLINVTLSQNGRVFLQAQISTTNRVDGPKILTAEPPRAPPASALKTVAEHVAEHYGAQAPGPPPFWTNIESKPQTWRPFEAPPVAEPRVTDWYRFVDYQPGDIWLDHARAALVLDLTIWAAHARSTGTPVAYRAPSIDLTVWFHEPAGDADWLLVDAVSDVAAGGLIHGTSRLWTGDGRLVATGAGNLLFVPPRGPPTPA